MIGVVVLIGVIAFGILFGAVLAECAISVLEADAYDLKYIGSQYNSAIYEYHCPVCGEDRTVDDDQFIEDEGD